MGYPDTRPGRDDFGRRRSLVAVAGSAAPGRDRPCLGCGALPGDYPEERQALGLATLRRDGFVSLTAGPEGGALTTRLLRLPGGRLTLNCATGERGSVAVELRDEAGQPVPGCALEQCDPIRGDALDFVASWSGEADLSGLADRPVRLYFELRDAELYAFRFATE